MLEEQRNKIDRIDDEIARLLAERLSVVDEVAMKKKEKNLPILNSDREQEILSRLTKDQEDEISVYTKILFNTIFDLSRLRQEALIGSTTEKENSKKECI